eukprot:SAG11_NODE_8_length_31217_cov_52.169677_15_plen_175_part_00
MLAVSAAPCGPDCLKPAALVTVAPAAQDVVPPAAIAGPCGRRSFLHDEDVLVAGIRSRQFQHLGVLQLTTDRTTNQPQTTTGSQRTPRDAQGREGGIPGSTNEGWAAHAHAPLSYPLAVCWPLGPVFPNIVAGRARLLCTYRREQWHISSCTQIAIAHCVFAWTGAHRSRHCFM